MKWILTLIVALLLAACGDNPTTSKPEAVTPGRIAMAKTGVSLAKMVAVTSDSGVQHLGTFKMSGRRFFELKNVGGAPIENLVITTSDSAFMMNPGFISVLETDGNSAFTPIVEIDVIHGTSITSGAPIERLLEYGQNDFVIYFDGTTLGERFHAEFRFSVYAIYIDSPNPDISVVKPEAKYGNEECNIWTKDGVRVNIGDTLKAWVNSSPRGDGYPIIDPTLFKTDCIVKQLLPEELQ